MLKLYNPDLPILIREAQGTPARIFARFGEHGKLCFFRIVAHESLHVLERGVEKHVDLENLSSADVANKVSQLLTVS